ncbi:hypothetical protein WA538_000963 [Blastocystis sp. DL]
MSEAAVTVRVRKFMRNPLLKRRQMTIEVVHPKRASVSKEELKATLAKKYNVQDDKCIILFGFRVAFGGGRSTGFALIYDSLNDVKKFEAKYRLARFGIQEHNRQGRKMLKEKKNHEKKIWGTGRRAALHKAKKAQDD